MQIARRLRAMIVNLADTLPAQRHPALHQELNLLDRMIGKLYATLTGFEPGVFTEKNIEFDRR